MSISTTEIRKHAIAAYQDGKGTQADIAKFYGVDISTFQRWLQRYRQTGVAAPLQRGHYSSALSEEQKEDLSRYLQERPDATLEQMRGFLRVTCSLVAIHNTLKRMGYRRKKNATGQRTRTCGC
ncbi:MAG: helix-turn-helix domain-containing protein [Candidatus Hydrogenedentes bacterium]|nr:helix-turn-helix domain-containing protein [Candidatus Hydrogenedentota bacterium]